MKKKLIAIAIAAAVAAPLTAQAVDMSGDARVRYYSNDVDGGTKGAQTDSRVGLNITMEDGKTAMAKVRLEVLETHGGATDTIAVDHAYIKANVGAGVTVTGGKTVANWGHRFYVWDAAGDRVAIGKKMGDMAFGLTFTKKTEAGLPLAADMAAGHEDDDADISSTTLSFKMGKMGGIRYDMNEDAGVAGADDTTTWNTVDIYGGAPLGGGWGLAFEVNSTGGDKDGLGFMLAGAGKVAKTDLTVGYASVKEGAGTDNDFFQFAGTGAQAGSMMSGLSSTKDVYSMSAMFVVAKMSVAATTALELGAGKITMTEEKNSGQEGDETVFSAKINHSLSKNTSVIAQYGSFSGDLLDATHMGASIESKF